MNIVQKSAKLKFNATHFSSLLLFLIVLGFFFAKVEIQIEGSNGWATGLPTWRIEHHWLLDLFWGGRAMTGYHAWLFSFIALFFHLPFFFVGKWSWRLEARVISSVALFWLIEDFLWFVLNPAFGLGKFNPESVPWHHHWLGGLPVDYWWALVLGMGLLGYSYIVIPTKALFVTHKYGGVN